MEIMRMILMVCKEMKDDFVLHLIATKTNQTFCFVTSVLVDLPNPNFVASHTNAALYQAVASSDADDIAATVLSIDTEYTDNLAAIKEGNVMLASLGSSDAADETTMGSEMAHKKRSAVDEPYL
jgi:hypothetical protein